jgi:S-adenosylmethionine:tRNA ribosyltransferase-isomerase
MSSVLARTRFRIPEGAEARVPPEARGLARDEVRLMVSSPLGIAHTQFRRIADYLEPGDLLVVNTSATIAAAVPGSRADSAVFVHFSGPAARGHWVVELRDSALHRVSDACAGERIQLPHGATLTLDSGWPDRSQRSGSRLWLAKLAIESGVADYLQREGRAIAYDHVQGSWPLSDYQTVFAGVPGSAEMASAGRPFSERVIADLETRGIGIAPLVLHTGVSSLEAGERPLPEHYEVPAATARRVNEARARGGRIIATGTTVTRALETVAAPDGTVRAGCGITDLVIDSQRPPRVVNGLITGWHEPEASHLLLLEAVAGEALVARSYAAATDPANGGYLWHEFGDSCLLLP